MMRTTKRAACAALLLAVLWPTAAHAREAREGDATSNDDNSANDDEIESSRDWMLGVGVGFPAFNAVGYVGDGAVAGLAGPLYSAGVERRLGGSLWLTGTVRGSYQQVDAGDELGGNSTSFALGGDLGLRHVINPEDRFQVSLLTSIGASRSQNGLGNDTTSAWSVHADVGFALDFWVAEPVALRVGSPLLSLGYQRANYDTVMHAWYAQLGLAPSFAVQLAF